MLPTDLFTKPEVQIPRISDKVSGPQRSEIERFASEINLYWSGAKSEEEFRAFRLENGVYGIRFQKDIQMVRVKVRFGKLTADQMDRLGQIARVYANGIGHVTTRQDVQFHWIPLERVPSLLAEIADVGLTTREACGNTVRNVTLCPEAGVNPSEPFDVTPYADALSAYLLRNPVCQNLPRKFKIAFSGCPEDCAMTAIHDLGFIAQVREEGGKQTRGFRVYVGGGLGPIPKPARLLEEFVSVDEYMILTEAVLRIFDRMGDRRRRNRARLKFLIDDCGVEAFRKLVNSERRVVSQTRSGIPFPRVPEETHIPQRLPQPIRIIESPLEGYQDWLKTNVKPQKQHDYCMAYITLAAGDLTSKQFHEVAELSRKYADSTVRTTPVQNLLLRWVHRESLPSLHADLVRVGLASPGVNRIGNVVGCPGADTCNLAITTSHKLARVLIDEFEKRKDLLLADDLKGVTIKVSGCPNACGHHHIATIGLYGGARRAGERTVPYYHVLLGGEISEGKVNFGRFVAKIPAKNVPPAVFRIIDLYRSRRINGEAFLDWVKREDMAVTTSTDGGIMESEQRRNSGEESIDSPLSILVGSVLADLEQVPDYEADPDFYKDWGEKTDFKLKIGKGECAGPTI